MKTAGLVLLAIGCAVLMQGASSAAPSGQGSSKRPANAISDHKQDSHAAAAGVPHTRARGTNSNRSKRLSMNQERSTPARSMNQSGASRSDVTKQAFMHHGTMNSGLPVRPPTVVSPAVLSLGNARHGGPNPPILGGPANSNTGTSGGINGTGMKRRR